MVRHTQSPAPRTNRKKKKNPAQFKISADVRRERAETIRELLPREQSQIQCRDAEFARFLVDQYREYCPRLRSRYSGLTRDVLHDCIDWINTFHGVNKKTADAFVVDKRFDLGEGRSWVDQRRSKKIVPLFVFWLDVIADAVNHMRESRPELPRDLATIIVEKLLTTSYHPKSSQSNQTALVCMQSLHTPTMRENLAKFGIIVPDTKKQLNPFISALRDKVENRRLSLPIGNNNDAFAPVDQHTSDSSDCESEDTPSLVDSTSSLESVMAERDEWKMKFYDLLAVHEQFVAAQQEQQNQQQQLWPNFFPEMPFALPPPVAGYYGGTWESPPSPELMSSMSSGLASPSLSLSARCDVDGDVPITDVDVNEVPLRLPAEALGFLNDETLGF